MNAEGRIRDHLRFLYGETAGDAAYQELRKRMDVARPRIVALRPAGLGERDALVITYGDQVRESNMRPLRMLGEFCVKHLDGIVTGIHILPFYPYTSDDGFSVVDYKSVDPALGHWTDVAHIGHRFRPMFDAVINHISRQSAWFQAYLRGEKPSTDYFIECDPKTDLSRVVRPRALPLLTPVATARGTKHVWTTFSDDQIDLNFRNPQVLLEVLDVLLSYAAHGAEFLRLDAIAYLWKEPGTSCIHLPQTHRIIQLIRAVFDVVAPHVMLITETNVPHADNVSYFGDGTNEAQLVYNFALPPLVLHAIHIGNATALTRWAAGLSLPSDRVTFFNFLASHDGIGLNPARGILPDAEINAMVERVRAHGGLVSYKNNPDGSHSPYELNVNYFNALSDPRSGEPLEPQVDRFMAAQAIMLSLVGMPGIYFHSLFGSRGWPEGVKETGRNRTINRQKLERAALERELAEPASLRSRMFRSYARLLQARAGNAAFNPYAPQRVIECGDAVFAVLRVSLDGQHRVLCLHNVSNRPQKVALDFDRLFGTLPMSLHDLNTRERIGLSPPGAIELRSYQVAWLTNED